jgi:PKHD-type hydroxylase
MVHLVDGPHINFNFSEELSRGGGGWDFIKDRPDNWAWMEAFSKEECESIIRIGKANTLRAGETYGKNDTRRNSNVCFLKPTDQTDWIFHRLTEVTLELNQNYFQFDITGFSEGFQFTEYIAPAGNYGWHADGSPGNTVRKLTMVAQLSDPDDYEGGELQLNPAGDEHTIEKKQGLVTIFPSHTLHQVTPVTSGSRYSLVIWVAGPRFK